MKINGEHLFADKPITFIGSTIGELALFPISYGHDMQLLKSVDGLLETCDPLDFARRMLPYVCYLRETLDDKQSKPDSPSLTRADVDRLSEEEVNAIAGTFVENQPHLTRRLESQTKKNEKGESVTSLDYGEIAYPKEDAESHVQYLHRLYVLHDQRMREQAEAANKLLLGSAHFSRRLSQNIANTLSMGEALSKASQAMRVPQLSSSVAETLNHLQMQADSRPSPVLSHIDFSQIEENRRAPFDALAARLDQLVELTTETISFATESNRTQTAIAAEIKASGESAAGFSKWNIGLTITVIVLSVVAIGLTAWGFKMASTDRSRADKDSQAYQEYAKQITNSLTDLTGTIESSGQSSSDDLKAMLAEMTRNRQAQDDLFRAVLAEQAQLIAQQDEQRLDAQKRIDELTQRLSELESQITRQPPQTQPAEGQE